MQHFNSKAKMLACSLVLSLSCCEFGVSSSATVHLEHSSTILYALWLTCNALPSQLAHAAAAAAAVRSKRVCQSGHQPAICRTQAAGQHEVGRLQCPSHGCSYRSREIAILLWLRCQATAASRDNITHSQLTV